MTSSGEQLTQSTLVCVRDRDMIENAGSKTVSPNRVVAGDGSRILIVRKKTLSLMVV